MCEVSVIMSVCNQEKHVHAAIKSILNQSFKNFELILSDFGSTDNTLSIIKSFDDSRIRVIAHNGFQHRIQALNAGLVLASGKYIAIMEADHIMHVDRLKIQHATMEAETSITVCGSHIKRLGAQKQEKYVAKPPALVGLLENPLSAFLQGNCIIHATAMIRNRFLKEHQLQYEIYPDAEDFKLWAEIAKCRGQFYVDTQTLLYCHSVNEQEDEQKQQSSENIIWEIVDFLAKDNYELSIILTSFKKLQYKEMMTQQDIVTFFHHFFYKKQG